MLWVLNVGEGCRRRGSRPGWFRGIRESRLAAERIWRVESFPIRLERWFSIARHTYGAHAEAGMVFVKGTAWLGAIKDIDLVSLFSLDLGGG